MNNIQLVEKLQNDKNKITCRSFNDIQISKNIIMKKTLSLICLLLIAFSCTDSDSVNTESEIIPDRKVYVAGYIKNLPCVGDILLE